MKREVIRGEPLSSFLEEWKDLGRHGIWRHDSCHDQWDAYLGNAKMLRPELERSDSASMHRKWCDHAP